MERRFSLWEGRGWLTVREEKNRAVCAAQLPNDGKGLYKCWLTGGGGKALLGTFVPQGGVLRLERTLTISELERQGAWPPEGGQAVLAFSFDGAEKLPAGWQREDNPGRLMGEPLLAAAARGPALIRRDENGFLLAYLYRKDRPFGRSVVISLCLRYTDRMRSYL